MIGRQSQFRRLDLDSLFFAFYYLQGSYQQYLAAVELKRRGWQYHARFCTWMKRDSSKKERRTLYFDYENEWRVRVSTSADLQVDDCPVLENEVIYPSDQELQAILKPGEFESFAKSSDEEIESLKYGSTIRARRRRG